jgi:hypothetical protein
VTENPVTIPRTIRFALVGLALTASLTACGSARRIDTYREQGYSENDDIATYETGRIREREADTRRIVQDELNRQRRP